MGLVHFYLVTIVVSAVAAVDIVVPAGVVFDAVAVGVVLRITALSILTAVESRTTTVLIRRIL